MCVRARIMAKRVGKVGKSRKFQTRREFLMSYKLCRTVGIIFKIHVP